MDIPDGEFRKRTAGGSKYEPPEVQKMNLGSSKYALPEVQILNPSNTNKSNTYLIILRE